LLGESYMRMEDPKGARRAWKELVERYPKDRYAGRARDELVDLGG
jgi:TolA-binding protein